MAPFVWLYIALYGALSLWGIHEDVVHRAPVWKALLSTVGNALGMGGMIVWAAGIRSAEIQSVWTWVFPFLLLQAGLEARFEYRTRLAQVLPETQKGDAQMRNLMLTSVVIGTVLALPYFLINYWVAFEANP